MRSSEGACVLEDCNFQMTNHTESLKFDIRYLRYVFDCCTNLLQKHFKKLTAAYSNETVGLKSNDFVLFT